MVGSNLQKRISSIITLTRSNLYDGVKMKKLTTVVRVDAEIYEIKEYRNSNQS
jgi:hypothetical protein